MTMVTSEEIDPECETCFAPAREPEERQKRTPSAVVPLAEWI